MVLDSNIVIGYLNGDANIIASLQSLRQSNTVLFISSVTSIEALSLASLTPENTEHIEAFLNGFIIVPVDMRIVPVAAALRRRHRLTVPDAAVVATAMVNN